MSTHRTGHGKTLSYYQLGRTATFASRSDQRFAYCCYVPESYDESGAQRYPLVVLMHGSGRNVSQLRDQFADFCEQQQCIALVPLFPAGIDEPGELHNYKYLAYRGIRFDRVLLDMVDEIANVYRVDAERFLLHGFSGGAQLAHRFFYLYPRRLLGVSIGAPGTVTLPDSNRPWWVGIRDLEQRFGIAPDTPAMRAVSVHMVVGAADIETWEVTLTPKSRHWMEGANDAGATRIERLRTLARAFEEIGIPVRFDLVPGAAHQGHLLHASVKTFFAETLAIAQLRAPALKPEETHP